LDLHVEFVDGVVEDTKPGVVSDEVGLNTGVSDDDTGAWRAGGPRPRRYRFMGVLIGGECGFFLKLGPVLS
jgi:hypothetical protein